MEDFQKPLVTIELAEYQGMIKRLETYEKSSGVHPIKEVFEEILNLIATPNKQFTFNPYDTSWDSRNDLVTKVKGIIEKSNVRLVNQPNGKLVVEVKN